MKNKIKFVGTVVLLVAMLGGIAGCANAQIKETSEDIMKNALAFKGRKVTKYFNQEDKYCDDDAELFEEYMDNFVDYLEMDYDEVKVKDIDIEAKKKDATVDFVFEIEDEEFEFELNLTKDGDEWVIDDNEDFIISVWSLYFDISYETGSKSQREKIDTLMERYDADDTDELASEFYEYSVMAVAKFK